MRIGPIDSKELIIYCFAEWIADGCGVLGTGGGGSTYPPFLMARQLLRDGKKIRVK